MGAGEHHNDSRLISGTLDFGSVLTYVWRAIRDGSDRALYDKIFVYVNAIFRSYYTQYTQKQ